MDRCHRIRDDRGFVLIAVIGIVMLLSVISLAAYAMTSENLHQTLREKRSTQALHVADAGLDQAMWRVEEKGDQAIGTFTVTTPVGTASVTTTRTAPFLYSVSSVGRSAEDSSVTRRVHTEIFSMSLWNFVMASNSASPVGSGGGHFNGNGTLNGPFYIRGSLDFSGGNSSFFGGPLFVKKGDIVLSGSSVIGQSTQLVDVYCDGRYPNPGDPNWFVSKGGTVNPNVPEIDLPTLNQEDMEEPLEKKGPRALAQAESTDGYQGRSDNTSGTPGPPNTETRPSPAAGCPQSLPGAYKIVDNDTNINRSLASGLNLYTSTPDFGYTSDDFALVTQVVGGVSSRVLIIHGTVFVDGPVVIGQDSSDTLYYTGNGTLLVNGNVTMNGNLRPLNTFPDVDSVGIAAATPPANMSTVSGTMNMNNNNTTATGAFYAGYAFNMTGNNQSLTGSILAPVVGLGHNGTVTTVPSLPSYLPPSLPGGDGNMTFPSSWHEGAQ